MFIFQAVIKRLEHERDVARGNIEHLEEQRDALRERLKVLGDYLQMYLGTTLTNQNSIPEEIKSRLRPGNACYHSVQNFLSSRLLSKNLKIKIYRTIILPVVLYGCETWSLTLREERKLRVFENMVLR